MSKGFIRKTTLIQYLLNQEPVNGELVDMVKEFPDAENVSEIEWTPFTTLFDGNFIRTIQCTRCGNIMTESADRPFDACPYCFARREGAE